MPRGVYPRKTRTTHDKFWSHVEVKDDADACWPWTGSRDKSGRYGRFSGWPGTQFAHRIALMMKLDITYLPPDVVAHHTCHERPDHTPLCCNPNHLEPMAEAEHKRMHANKRWADHRAGRRKFRG